MTQYTRTIARQITNAFPTWRSDMASPDTLYYVSAGVPSSANAAFAYPGQGTVALAYGFTTNENYADDLIGNYASGTLLHDDGGAYGSMVFGVGGHTRIQTQILRCNLSEDAPTWDWFQQPTYELSDTNGADHYWNPAEVSGFASNRKIAIDDNASGWDKGFPMGFADGWVYQRKIKNGEVGNGVLHGYRFNCVAYVPPSVTGWGVGGFLANNHSPQGPFAQSFIASTGMALGDLVDAEALGTTVRLDKTAVCNVSTGEWTFVPDYGPDIAKYGEFIAPTVVVSSRTKRAYVLFIKASQEYGFYCVDMADGVEAATYSAWTRLLGTDGDAYPNAYSMAAFTEGFSRDLLYAVHGSTSTDLVLMDLDAGTAQRLAIDNATAMPNAGSLLYDRNRHRLLHVHYDSGASAFRVIKIGIPADVTDEDAYTVSTDTISVDGSVSFTAPTNTDWFGRISYHPGLDVVLIAQVNKRLLAFRPS